MSYAKNGGNEIWWEERGAGEPLLLVMGHGWDARMWWRALPALSACHRVLLFDNRGIGRTRWDGRPFGIEDLANDAFAVLDAAGVDSAHVYGMSMGGLIAQEVALSRPERVRSLVLGCTAAFGADSKTTSRVDALRARIPFALAASLFRSALYGPDADKDAVAEDLKLMRSASTPSHGLLAQSRAVRRYKSLERVSGIAVPTLVLHGSKDRAVKLELGRELASLIPGAALHVLEGAGHAYHAEPGTEATDVLLRFFAGQPA